MYSFALRREPLALCLAARGKKCPRLLTYVRCLTRRLGWCAVRGTATCIYAAASRLRPLLPVSTCLLYSLQAQTQTQTPRRDTSKYTTRSTHTDTEIRIYKTEENAAMHRKSSRDHARPHRRHVQPQRETPTHAAVADVLLASDQSIHTRWRGEHRL